MQEMKVGFMAALEQLSSMQDGEQGGWHKVEATCLKQDQQISDLTQSLDTLRVQQLLLLFFLVPSYYSSFPIDVHVKGSRSLP